MTPETGFLLLGMLIAICVVLVAGAIFVGTLSIKGVRYVGRFKGLQASRNARGEMTFGGVIDEALPEPELTEDNENTSPPPEAMN